MSTAMETLTVVQSSPPEMTPPPEYEEEKLPAFTPMPWYIVKYSPKYPTANKFRSGR